MKIELDNKTITHMLGYLSVVHWADAIRHESVDLTIAEELMLIQDRIYGGEVYKTVKEAAAMTKDEYTLWRYQEE